MTLHKKIAKLFGYNLIRFEKIKAATVESAALNIIDRYGIDLVLDVGANAGQYSKALRKEGYTGAIHSFEPGTGVWTALSEACAADAGWTAHKMALGARCEKKTMNILEGTKLSSFHKPNAYGGARFSNCRVVGTEEVDVGTVDDFLSGLDGFSGRVFLKMDTQGYDLEVFAGAQKSLSKIAAIQSEMSFLAIYTDMPYYADALKAYEAAGFRVARFFPITADQSLAAIEMDCLLINQNHHK